MNECHSFYTTVIKKSQGKQEALAASCFLLYLAEQAEDAEPPDAEILVARLKKCMLEIPITAAFVRIHLEKYKEKVVVVKSNADRERLFELIKRGAINMM